MNRFLYELRAIVDESSDLIALFSKVLVAISAFILFLQKIRNPEYSIDPTNTLEVIISLIMCLILISIVIIVLKDFLSLFRLNFIRVTSSGDNSINYRFFAIGIIICVFILILACDKFSFWILKQSRIRVENVKIMFIDKDSNVEIQNIIQNCQVGTINQTFRDSENFYFECTKVENNKTTKDTFYFPKSLIYVYPN